MVSWLTFDEGNKDDIMRRARIHEASHDYCAKEMNSLNLPVQFI